MTDDVAKLVWELCGLDSDETMWGYDREEFAQYLLEELPSYE